MEAVIQHSRSSCTRKTTSTGFFRNHLRIDKFRNCDFNCAETSAEPYRCQCGYRNFLTISMKKHIKEKHEQSSRSVKMLGWFMNYGCRKCSFRTHSILLFWKHNWKCALNVSKTANLLEKNTNRRFESDICCYQTKLLEWIMEKNHVRNHTTDKGDIWFHCYECGLKTRAKGPMKRHFISKHTADEDVKWIKCDKCDFKTNYKQNMKRHAVVTHTADEDVKWIECDKCDYKTNYKHNMKRHAVVKHTADQDVKWIECDKCDFKTNYKQNMKRHAVVKHRR